MALKFFCDREGGGGPIATVCELLEEGEEGCGEEKQGRRTGKKENGNRSRAVEPRAERG